MPKVKAQITISLDGYMAGPNQSGANPLGEGGETLHEWAFMLQAMNEMHGREGGERLFDHLAPGAADFELGDVVDGREALHLTYRLR